MRLIDESPWENRIVSVNEYQDILENTRFVWTVFRLNTDSCNKLRNKELVSIPVPRGRR